MRGDLPFSQQAVQACHACIESARTLLPPSDPHPTLVLCAVKSETRLWLVFKRLERLGIALRPFREPDRGGELTALATGPVRGDQRHLFRQYQCLRGGESVSSNSIHESEVSV